MTTRKRGHIFIISMIAFGLFFLIAGAVHDVAEWAAVGGFFVGLYLSEYLN